MTQIGSWEWRTTPPLTITREIVSLTIRAHQVLYVFLVNGRVELRDECNVAEVDHWLFTVAPKSSPNDVLKLLQEGTALDAHARRTIGRPLGSRSPRNPDGPLHERIVRALRAGGEMIVAELAKTLNEDEQSVRCNLSLLMNRGMVDITDIRVPTVGYRTARKYRLTPKAEAA